MGLRLPRQPRQPCARDVRGSTRRIPSITADELYRLDDGGPHPAGRHRCRAARRARPQLKCGYRIRTTQSIFRSTAGDRRRLVAETGLPRNRGRPVDVKIGDQTYQTSVEPGVHTLLLRGRREFDTIKSRASQAAPACAPTTSFWERRSHSAMNNHLVQRIAVSRAERDQGGRRPGVVATHTAFDTGEVTRGWHGAVCRAWTSASRFSSYCRASCSSRPFFLARHRRSPPSVLPHFVWKRGLRILPLYWVGGGVPSCSVPEKQRRHSAVCPETHADADLLRRTVSYRLTQMWSLCTEVAFYAILPALCWALLRSPDHPAGNLRRCARGLVADRVQDWAGKWSRQSQRNNRCPLCAVVAWIPALVRSGHGVRGHLRRTSRHTATRMQSAERAGRDLWGCWLLAGAVFALACTPLAGHDCSPSRPRGRPSSNAACTPSARHSSCCRSSSAPSARLARRLLATPGLVWLGEVSYGIFCLHLIVLETVLDVLDVAIFTGQFQEVFLVTVRRPSDCRRSATTSWSGRS